ncbi:MAG: orotidine-5'-phosphate decarboxylase [Acidimicrobiia bacterium]|nr:orotidine-5'-phosphate decarboxylase [Acidimicrobiia bacterium]MDH3396219.1 orotidine-5'-phosphate decarboxylase [Acidimicrobiia bacterium]
MTRVEDSANPILVALDVSTAEESVRLAKTLIRHVGGFKVGLELLMGPGPAVVASMASLGKPVLADAKLHDIPTTVGRAARQLGRLGARWVTVHASGGSRMLRAAVDGLEEGAGGRPAGILVVTVLTSMTADDLAEAGISGTPGRQTARLSKLAASAGCEGVVCSPEELGVVDQVAPDLLKVTPGIRLTGTATHDQRRTADPAEAMRRGADYLVIGRPIVRASDPVGAVRAILKQAASGA